MDRDNLTGLEVAVIGMAGKFPGSKNIEQLWDNLVNGKELVSFFSQQELEEANIQQELLMKKNYVRAKGIIEDAEKFDYKYFGYKPKEAQMMDPQIRMMHLCVNDALENAGYCSHKYNGKIGLFVGANPNYNWEYAVRNSSYISEGEIYSASILANKDFISTIIAYNMDLKGPCVTLDCACSTSLVAVDEAAKQLLIGACDIAVSGACAMDSPIKTGYEYQENSIVSPDGHCRPFDKDAHGTLNSEGAAAVVLKRLEDALEDGDNIYAIIKGSAVNNDGSNKVGYTAPSVQGQCDVIKSALYMAEIESESISYIETHGTATPLGDMVEIEALTQAFDTDKKQFCRIGSIKSNFGHLSTAAGIAGFIKAVLCISNRMIPPSINYKENNPKIHMEKTPFMVNSQLYRYEDDVETIHMGVSSFGIGGTNAYVLLEDGPEQETEETDENNPLIFTLSGTSQENLKKNILAFGDYIKTEKSGQLEDIAYGLVHGKQDLKYRATIVADKKETIKNIIQNYNRDGYEENLSINTLSNGEADIVFMFDGQGNQYYKMAHDLYQKQLVFRKYIDECFEYIEKKVHIRMQDILYGEDANAEILNETFYCQLGVFSVDYAMARFLIDSNVNPSAVIGHSLGEYVAACVAGVFSVEDALDIVMKRAELMQQLERGKMLSVILDEDKITEYVTEDICISVRNGKDNYVLAGTSEAIECLKETLDEDEIRYREIRTSHAFHSHMVEPVLDEFREFLAGIKMNKPKYKMVSNLTGEWMQEDSVIHPEYWIKHLRSMVKFYEGINTLLVLERAIFIEVGPGNTLSNFVNRNEKKHADIHVVNTIRNRNTECDDVSYLYRKMGALWAQGVCIDFRQTYRKSMHKKVHLPGHIYELERCYAVYENIITLEKKESNIRFAKSMVYLPCWKEQRNFSGKKRQQKQKYIFITNHTKVSTQVQQLLEDEGKGIQLVSEMDFLETIEGEGTTNAIYICDYEQENMDYDIKKLYPMIRYFEEHRMKLNLTVITVLGMSIGVGENINICEATVGGFVKAVYSECRYVNTRLIDIDRVAINEILFRRQFVDDLLDNKHFSFIAYRGEKRYVEFYMPFDELMELEATEQPVSGNATFVLIGGLGNVGSVICNVLQKERCNFVILNRSIEILDHTFDKWLACHDKTDTYYKKIKRLSDCEAAGCKVQVLKCDVSDEAAVLKVAEYLKNSYFNVKAIFHLAGDITKKNFRKITELEETDFVKQFAPKVTGTMNIEKMVEIVKPDHCILMSSLSSILGGIGFSAYASANGFLNQYVYSNHKTDYTQWTSIVWDGWDFGEEGNNYQYSILPEEGEQIIQRILQCGWMPQYVIAKGNLLERLEQYNQTCELKDKLDFSSQQTQVSVEDMDKLKYMICESIKGYFGFERVNEKDNIFELGATSLDILQIVKVIEKECSIRISPTLFYTYPTINALVDSLEKKEDEFGSVRENKLSKRKRNKGVTLNEEI